MTSDNTCIIGCFQLKNDNPMCEHPAHQVNVSRIGVLCALDSSNFFGHPVYDLPNTPKRISVSTCRLTASECKLNAFEYENKVEKVITTLKDRTGHPLKRQLTEILT